MARPTTMTSLRTLLAALVAATGLVLIAPAPASACSCATAGPGDHVARADLVVVGEAATIAPERGVIGSVDPVVYTIRGDRVLKGASAAAVDVVSARMGASCGLEGIETGRGYVVFAAHQDIEGDRTRELWATLCGGTGPASPAYLAEVEAVTGPGSPPRRDDSAVAVSPAASAPGKHRGDEAGSAGRGVPGWAWGEALTAGVALGVLVLHGRRSGPSGR